MKHTLIKSIEQYRATGKRMRQIERKRPDGIASIAVADDDLAQEWQECDALLVELNDTIGRHLRKIRAGMRA